MRPFDHLVLPVADLAVARARYETLGFTVAPDGIHPFGTANCCIFFQAGGFIEPLAVADADQYQAGLADVENAAFVQGHRNHTEKIGPEGFSHIVLKSRGAAADRQAFSAGRVLSGRTQFSRTASNGLGEAQKVSFDLTFAADRGSAAAGFFTCESLLPLEIDFSKLLDHPNGVTGISHIFSSADEPHKHASFVETFVGRAPNGGDECISAGLGDVTWLINTPGGLADSFQIPEPELKVHDAGMAHQAVRFEVPDILATLELLESSGLPIKTVGEFILVPPGAGQGCWFVFAPGG
ncbi:MAG: VOC family protein [Pseudomonadota bacterium]